MAKVAKDILENGLSDEAFGNILWAISNAGSRKVKQFIAAELLVLEALKREENKEYERQFVHCDKCGSRIIGIIEKNEDGKVYGQEYCPECDLKEFGEQ